MKRCKHVEFYDGFHHELEEIERQKYKLREIEGEIIFCESNRNGLIMRLDSKFHPEETKNKEIIWAFENQMSIPAICGQRLRCFYEKTYLRGNEEDIHMDAWELLDKPNSSLYVVRRAAKHDGYKFVEFTI